MTATLQADPTPAWSVRNPPPPGVTCARPTCPRRPMYTPGAQGLCQHHAHAAHIVDDLIDATATIEHVRECLASGASMAGIAKATGVGVMTVCRISHGETPTVRRSTADKLRRATSHMIRWYPALGTVRRLQALRAAGWTMQALADGVGMYRSRIVYYTTGHGTDSGRLVHPATLRRVRDFFNAHQEVVGTPTRQVRDHQWPLPASWDDPDDPDEKHYNIRPAFDLRPGNSPGDHPAWKKILATDIQTVSAATGLSPSVLWKVRSRGPKGEVSLRRFDKICTALGIDQDPADAGIAAGAVA